MKHIYRQYIDSPEAMGGDGLGLQGDDFLVEECIIDLSHWPLSHIDEAVGVTLGGRARFKNCVIRGAGKLVLAGCGDADALPLERGSYVTFYRCLLENFSRRGVEAQSGMYVGMRECVIRNWGQEDRFTVRTFASWAHTGGEIFAQNCVYDQPRFWRGWTQMWADFKAHVGQAWNDEGPRGLVRGILPVPGVCRGLYATAGGLARAEGCRALKWWIRLPKNFAPMSKAAADTLVRELEDMDRRLQGVVTVRTAA